MLYVQRESVNIWKENIIKDLESRELEYVIVEEFLIDLKKEFEKGDNETMKIAELKKVEQESRIIEEFIQKFRRAVRNSRYEKRPLMKEFKRGINGVIRRNLIKLEYFPTSIKQ